MRLKGETGVFTRAKLHHGKKLPVGRRDAITHRRLFFYVPLAMMIGRVVVVVFFFIGRPD